MNTALAILAGCAIGAVLAVGNIYMGLKTGWYDTGCIPAAIVGFAGFAGLQGLCRRRAYSPHDNNLTQVAAGAVAAVPPAAGMLAAFPALSLMGERDPGWGLAAWGLVLSGFGLLVALCIRRQLIVDEALPFPTGTATGKVIEAMHAKDSGALGRARLLLWSVAGAMIFVWLRDGAHFIPALTSLPGGLAGVPLAVLTFGLSHSPMMVGAGVLVGPRIGLGLLVGALLAWGGVAPWLLRTSLVAHADYAALSNWLIWPGMGLMVAGALMDLLQQGRVLWRAGTGLSLAALGARVSRSIGPIGWAAGAGVVLGTVLLGRWAFGMHPLITLAALVLAVVLGATCARASGETDIALIGPMGQIGQAVFSLLVPGQPALNIVAASVIAGSAAQTTQALDSFKAGQRLGAAVRPQVLAQLCGMAAGALISVPAYRLLTRTYGLGTEAFPVPSARVWQAIAETVSRRGGSGLPGHAAQAALLALLCGACLTLLSRCRVGRFLPSALAAGVGFLIPAHYAASICLGGLLLAAARALRPAIALDRIALIGSGAIAGESLMGVVCAVLIAAGLLKG